MAKLVVQIPCYNEERTLPVAYAALPKEIPGIDEIEVLIVDDGSQDRTLDVARELAPEKDPTGVDAKLEGPLAVLHDGGRALGHGRVLHPNTDLGYSTDDGIRD